MKKHPKIIVLLLIVSASTLSSFSAIAQKKTKNNQLLYSNKFSIVMGLIQPVVLKGGNIEFTYYSKKMSFDYSHGFSLDMSDKTLTGDAKIQKVALHLPYSTGFGIGYRFSSFFDVRFEPKMHSWQVYHASDTQNQANLIKSYKTYTLGLGAYYRYMPFKSSDTWLQGITASSSVRWWPNVGSTLNNNKFSYFNKYSQKEETLTASNIGIAGTPIICNISIGYTFGGK